MLWIVDRKSQVKTKLDQIAKNNLCVADIICQVASDVYFYLFLRYKALVLKELTGKRQSKI